MKNLPLGIQTFRDIIESDYLYVDKTKDIYEFLVHKGKYFFLSRPRRFGKSLLISTLEQIFLGNQELFKGLWIYDKIEWKKYPVIRIDFSNMLYTEGINGFKESLFSNIKDVFKQYNLEIESNNYKDSFKELLLKLSKIEKVVILIDEYDKPIINFVDNLEIAKGNRDILRNFYETIKACDEYIKFAFLTGVSKFSKVSIFSGLNNLRDITLDEKFATITGYTEEELFSYFDEHIKVTSNKMNITEQELKELLKTWYNGYSWDGKNFVYNPFSILNVFTVKQINNYWFKSGTPTFLIKLIKEKEIDIKSLDKFIASDDVLDSFEIEDIDVESLLFQTGYLTIKEIIEPHSPFREYVLTYPNMEVRESLLTNILIGFSESKRNNQIKIGSLVKALNKNNLDEFFTILKDIFSHIPAVIFMSDKEAYYHTIIYLILTLIGIRIFVEVHTNIGRIDAVVETNLNIYIFEFKMNSSNEAIKQIGSRKYYESYLLSKKDIVFIGVSFDSKQRNIKEWKVSRQN